MKIYIVFILTILLVNVAVAQNETTISKTVANEFQKKYNANDYEGIFTMFAKEMKSFMPHDETLAFLSTLNTQAGTIKKRTFIKYPQANVALYKTTFERAVVSLFISVDGNFKINGLMVKPFVEVNNSENVINNLSIKDGLITKEQSQLIFENAKTFPNHTQISIAIIKDGKVNYYGINKKNDTLLSVNNQKSVFEIGSISKVFTSTLLANFVIDGKIQLNNNTNNYLNSPFSNDRNFIY